MLQGRSAQPILTLADWPRPKNPVTQWQAGRSAMELARAWTRSSGGCSPPAELSALLRSHPAFADARIVSGTPEDLVTFDKFSGPRNADLNLFCESPRGAVVISIEAKADESYGGTVGDRLKAAKKRKEAGLPSNAAARVEMLLQRLAPQAAHPDALPYQLLTATAAALMLGTSHGAVAVLLLIHEFINGTRDSGEKATDDDRVAANASALNLFMKAVSGGEVASIVAPSILGPFPVAGWPPSLYIGKLRTDLGHTPRRAAIPREDA